MTSRSHESSSSNRTKLMVVLMCLLAAGAVAVWSFNSGAPAGSGGSPEAAEALDAMTKSAQESQGDKPLEDSLPPPVQGGRKPVQGG
jgi:hypothetical protein